MEATYTLQHFKWTGATSTDGYPTTPAFAAPIARQVYGWYASSGHSSVSASQMASNAEYTRRVISSKVVLVPDTSVYSVLDKIVFPGGDPDTDAYFVSEDVRDYTNGPFGFKPGGEIIVEKVSG